MILPDGEVFIQIDDQGKYYFYSNKVDLVKNSLVFPVELEGGMGTIAFWKYAAILHPPNGKSTMLSVKMIINLFEEFGNDNQVY